MEKKRYGFDQKLIEKARRSFAKKRKGQGMSPKGTFEQYFEWFLGTGLNFEEIGAQLDQTVSAISYIHKTKMEPFFGKRKHIFSATAKTKESIRRRIAPVGQRFPEGSPAAEVANLACARGLTVKGVFQKARLERPKTLAQTLIVNGHIVSVARVSHIKERKNGARSGIVQLANRMEIGDFLVVLLRVSTMPPKNFIVPKSPVKGKRNLHILLTQRKGKPKENSFDTLQYEERWDFLNTPSQNESSR